MSDNKKMRKGEKTREKILLRAGKLFSDKGYHAISIDDIISGLGIAKGTMYQYFDGKLGLLKELLLFSNIKINEVFKNLDTKGKDCETVIREIYFSLMKLYFIYYDMVALTISSGDIFKADESIESVFTVIQNNYKKLLSPYKKDFRVHETAVPFVVFLQGEYIRGHMYYYLGKEKVTDDDIKKSIDFVMDVLKNGIFK